MAQPARPFDSSTMRGLTTALGGLSKRQNAISNNIANVETPGYRAQEVSFEASLNKLLSNGVELMGLETTHGDHIDARPRLNGRVDGIAQQHESSSAALRNDGNNVDVEREMALLSETSIRFAAVSQIVANRYASLKSAIFEGRR
jgi:flagellar basal-body rod protein FlgB